MKDPKEAKPKEKKKQQSTAFLEYYSKNDSLFQDIFDETDHGAEAIRARNRQNSGFVAPGKRKSGTQNFFDAEFGNPHHDTY